MARVALDLGIRELAEAAKVSTQTISRFERGDALKPSTIAEIRAALEAAGVIFLAESETADGGPGVRLKRQ